MLFATTSAPTISSKIRSTEGSVVMDHRIRSATQQRRSSKNGFFLGCLSGVTFVCLFFDKK